LLIRCGNVTRIANFHGKPVALADVALIWRLLRTRRSRRAAGEEYKQGCAF